MKCINEKPLSACSRREFGKTLIMGGAGAYASMTLGCRKPAEPPETAAFIASVQDYADLNGDILLRGMKEIGVSENEIKGKKILLKPNLVEPLPGSTHINTHPFVVRAAFETFSKLGASSVIVGEGAGHRRDFHLVLEESGYADALLKDGISCVDLNNSRIGAAKNAGRQSMVGAFVVPLDVLEADFVVSLAKMKTHHWAGVTLSMKNMFGIMPGAFYGWPKNLLHLAGIHESILDINATIRPNLAIVDGIVGMEGDGPIMGSPKKTNVLVLGRSLPAVDATCARIMGIDPMKIPYLNKASGWLGPVREGLIAQHGETIPSVRNDFHLLKKIPAHRGLRL